MLMSIISIDEHMHSMHTHAPHLMHTQMHTLCLFNYMVTKCFSVNLCLLGILYYCVIVLNVMEYIMSMCMCYEIYDVSVSCKPLTFFWGLGPYIVNFYLF